MLCQGDPAEKYATAQAKAKQYRQYVALWLVDPQAAATLDMLTALGSTKELRRSTDNYQTVFLDARNEPAQRLARSLGIDLAPPEQWPQIVLLDLDGHQLAQAELSDFSLSGEFDPTRLLDFMRSHGPEPLDARALLNAALAEARTSGRRVLVQETATWCGPCHALSKYLEQHRALWEKDYVWVRIDHRWKNSEEVIDQLRTDNTMGIPWLAIADGEGRVLATHLGYPRTPELADAFLKKIEQTRQHLTDDDLAKLRAGLSEK